jgi:hypothetical protein
MGGTVEPPTTTTTNKLMDNLCVASCFAKSRGWVAGSPGFTRDKGQGQEYCKTCFVEVLKFIISQQSIY